MIACSALTSSIRRFLFSKLYSMSSTMALPAARIDTVMTSTTPRDRRLSLVMIFMEGPHWYSEVVLVDVILGEDHYRKRHLHADGIALGYEGSQPPGLECTAFLQGPREQSVGAIGRQVA